MISAAFAFAAAAFAVAGAASILGARPKRTRDGFGRRLAQAVPARLKPPLDLAARLEAAGSATTPAELMAIKALAALTAAPLGAALATAAPGRLGPPTLVLVPVAAFFAPDLHLQRRTNARIRQARAELPNVLDLLRVAVDAGMAPSQALGAVGRWSDSLVATEWKRAADQIQLGVPLADATARLARRLPAAEVNAFSAALNRATRHGAPLSDTLAAQARDARLARRRRIEEQAAKAAPKIQLVVALLLVPSVLLLVAAAMLAAVTAH